jgi:hypothetical protein
MDKRRRRRRPPASDREAEWEPWPDGEYYLLIAYVQKGSDFAPEEAVARLQAALPGRLVRAFPCRRNRRVLDPLGCDLIVGFYIQASPTDADGPLPATAEGGGACVPTEAGAAVRQACEVLSGFRGVWACYTGGKAKLSTG